MKPRIIEKGDSAKYSHIVEWYELENGKTKRKRSYFNDKDKAESKLNRLTARTWAQGAEAVTLSHDEKAAVLHWRELVEEMEGVGDIPGLYDFVKVQAQKIRTETGKTIGDAVDSAVRKRKVEKKSQRTIKEIEDHGERLKVSLGAKTLVTLVTTDDIDDWLESLALPEEDGGRGLSGTTVGNHRRSAHTIFNEAVRKKWVTINPVRESFQPQKNDTEIHIVDAEDVHKLLAAAADVKGQKMLVPICLQLFAGFRTSEVARMTWGSIDSKAKVVKDVKSKTRKRIVPFLGYLEEALKGEPEHAPSDKVVDIDIWAYTHKVARIFRKAGVEKKPNVLRHSFCSYRVADCKSLDQTALEAANSAGVIREHYWRLVTDEQAEVYFNATLEAPPEEDSEE